MCEICKKVKTTEHFPTPQSYLDCLGYIQRLVDGGEFEFVSKSCDVDKVTDEKGRWANDVITHVIKCKGCGQCFTCSMVAFRGGGSFRKDR